MKFKKSYKFLLKLNPEQHTLCSKFSGSCRFVWNKALGLKKEQWEKDKTSLSQYDLNNILTMWKSEFQWLYEAPSQSLQQTNKDLDQAYKNFFSRCKKGNNPGHPKFKKKGKHDAFRLPQGIKLLKNLNHKTGVVKLPKLGKVKFVKTRKIEGDIKNVTISKNADKWYISFNCANVLIEPINKGMEPIGIDRGVKVFGMLSNGSSVKAPNPLKKNKDKLAKIQRKLSRKKKFSNNWNKQRLKLQRFQKHIADIRKDSLHKSSFALAKNHGTIVMEDLKTANMSKSAKGTIEKPGKNVKAKSGLNRVILDQGWHMFKTMVEYKLNWYGGRLILVDPKYTSQKCNICGTIDSHNRKSQEKFLCVHCGHKENADLNASKNILAAGLAVSACGEASLDAPVKQEAFKRKAALAA